MVVVVPIKIPQLTYLVSTNHCYYPQHVGTDMIICFHSFIHRAKIRVTEMNKHLKFRLYNFKPLDF